MGIKAPQPVPAGPKPQPPPPPPPKKPEALRIVVMHEWQTREPQTRRGTA